MDTVFQVGQYRVIETSVRDEMHPNRTVNTTYIENDLTGAELFISQDGFGSGPALTEERAWSLVSYNAQKGRI